VLATRAVNVTFREGSCYFLVYMYLRNKIEYAHIRFMNRTLYKHEIIRKLELRNHRKLELNLSKEKEWKRQIQYRELFKARIMTLQGGFNSKG